MIRISLYIIQREDGFTELDALGGNVGFQNPYIEIIQYPDPDLQNWDYLYNESPMYVNGQIVKATIDGMSVPISMAQRRMESGTVAVEYTVHISGRGFHTIQAPIDSYGGGLFGHETPPTWIRPNGDGRYTDNGGYNFFSFGDSRGGTIIKHPTRPLTTYTGKLTLTIGAVRTFLDNNPNCENFINNLLTQLGKDTAFKPEGDIRHYLDEFSKSGTLNFHKSKDGSMNRGGEPIHKPYKSQGWGVNMVLSGQTWNPELTHKVNVVTFLHEFIHAIGFTSEIDRHGKYVSTNGDLAVAKSLENLSIAKSVEEYMKDPRVASKVQLDGNGKPYIPFVGSEIFSAALDTACGLGTAADLPALKNR